MSLSVTLGPRFAGQLRQLEADLKQWSVETQQRTVRTHKLIGRRWKAEAQRRIPVGPSKTAKQRIVTDTDVSTTVITTAVGGDLERLVYIEFGTTHIAGGRVKALGTDPSITDAQAIKDWPAKDATQPASGQDERGRALGTSREQMPWLRPAFMQIRLWALQQLDEAGEPPRQGAG